MYQREDEETHQAGQAEAVQEDEAQDPAFLAVAAGCGAGDDDALRGDHFAHHAAGALAAAMSGGDAELLGGDLLQAAEEDVGGGVGAGGGSAEPPDERAEKGVEDSGAREGETESGVEAAGAGDVPSASIAAMVTRVKRSCEDGLREAGP